MWASECYNVIPLPLNCTVLADSIWPHWKILSTAAKVCTTFNSGAQYKSRGINHIVKSNLLSDYTLKKGDCCMKKKLFSLLGLLTMLALLLAACGTPAAQEAASEEPGVPKMHGTLPCFEKQERVD